MEANFPHTAFISAVFLAESNNNLISFDSFNLKKDLVCSSVKTSFGIFYKFTKLFDHSWLQKSHGYHVLFYTSSQKSCLTSALGNFWFFLP